MIVIYFILYRNIVNNIIMSQISPERLIKIQDKLCSQPFLKELRKEIRSNQQKIAKSTYNLESRNIKKFTQQWQAFKKNFKSAASNYVISKQNAAKKRFGRTLKYEENQSMQFQYDRRFNIKIPQIRKSPESRLQPSIDEASVGSKPTIKGRYSLKKNQLKSLRFQTQKSDKQSRQKSNSFIKESHKQPRNRIITQWQSNASKDHQIQSRISMKKGDSVPHPQLNSDDFFIDLSRQRINKYIENLHRLQWIYIFIKDHKEERIQESAEFILHIKKFKYDIDSSIDEYAINFMVSRRYGLLSCYLEDSYQRRLKELQEQRAQRKNTKFLQPSEYSLLNSLTSGSVIKLIKKNVLSGGKYTQPIYELQENKTLYFSLPHCQFISYRYTKSSIYQLISMSSSANLKIAFTIYDKNRNGVIDTDDLLQIISLSRKIPILEADIITITRAMMSETRKSTIVRKKIRIQSERFENTESISDRQYTQTIQYASPIKQESESSNQANSKALSSSRFNIDKLYTFLKGKEEGKMQQFSKETLQNNMHNLTFGMFCRAFQNERPVIILDMFQYLFGAPNDHFHPRYRPQLRTKLKYAALIVNQEQTLEQKWNRRLKQTNSIIQQFVKNKSQSKF